MTRPWTRAIALGALLAISAVGPALAQSPPADVPAQGAPGARARQFEERFSAANTTGDGRLTLAQARAGHMPGIVKNFSQIDRAGKGYVTMEEIGAYMRAQSQQRKAANPPG